MDLTYLLSSLLTAVQVNSLNRLLIPVRGDDYDQGGMVVGSNPLAHWLVVGTEAQMYFWRRELVKSVVPNEFLNFEDDSDWRMQSDNLVDQLGDFLPENGECPTLFWVTPIMSVIGRQLKMGGIKPTDHVRVEQPVEDSVRHLRCNFGGGESIRIDYLAGLFGDPPDCDDKTALHVITRRRELVLPDGTKRQSAIERMVCRAGVHVHSEEVHQGKLPTVAPFYATDDSTESESSGWIQTPHLTVIRLCVRDHELPTANIEYRAFRFDRGNARRLSHIWGRDDFELFVSGHPALRRLIENSIPAGDFGGDKESGFSRRRKPR